MCGNAGMEGLHPLNYSTLGIVLSMTLRTCAGLLTDMMTESMFAVRVFQRYNRLNARGRFSHAEQHNPSLRR